MAVRKGVAPTKTNLLKLRDELKFARLGNELLDQKRTILINELLSLIDQAVLQEEKVDQSLSEGYRSLEEAVLQIGKLKTYTLASAVNVKPAVTVKQRKVMGVVLPVVDTEFHDNPPYFSPHGTGYWVDRALDDFKVALKLTGQLAELKVSIMRLALEVKKTIRKVNALEKIVVPELDETVRSVTGRLEELERENFILMKMVKKRMEEGLK
jgi:V/A-type H+-transporting ATPase subunit D